MEVRENAGYTITDSVHIGDAEFVLGQNHADPAMFVTWKCANGTNYYWGHYVKVIQDALGHQDISTTLNIYADVTKELKKKEFENLDTYFT